MATGRQDPLPRSTPHGPAPGRSGLGQHEREVRLSRLAHGMGIMARTSVAKRSKITITAAIFDTIFTAKNAGLLFCRRICNDTGTCYVELLCAPQAPCVRSRNVA